MRRRRKEVPNTAQGELGMRIPESPRQGGLLGKDPRFTDDSPWHLFVGGVRLDEYLKSRGMGWVVRLRSELEAVDFGALTANYQRTGRNPFHPRTLLGLIVYGILNGQQSLRALESLAARDVGAWWICGGHQPDHSTIGDFIERHREVLSEEFVRGLVRGLIKRKRLRPGVVAGDATVVEAAASHYEKLSEEAAQVAAQRAQQKAEESPQDETLRRQAERAQRAAEAVAERRQRREQQGKSTQSVVVSGREPEAVLQPRKDGAMRFAYKPATLVHESGLIVGQAVHPSSETAVVDELMEQHRDAFGSWPKTALLDAGYCTPAVLAEMVERDVNVLCPSGRTNQGEDWEKKGNKGLFGKARFAYDEERNVYRCPAGAELRQSEQSCDAAGRPYRAYTTNACSGCELRTRCTTSRHGRKIKRYEGEEFKEAMARVLRQPAARREYQRRAPIAERPFAEFRERHGLRRFHRCGLLGAAVEFALHVIAFDLKWAIGYPAGSPDSLQGALILLWTRSASPGSPWRLIAVGANIFPQLFPASP